MINGKEKTILKSGHKEAAWENREGMDGATILELVGLLIGSGGVAAFATLKWERVRAKGEAKSAENEATIKLQDVYQELVEDVKKDREEQKEYIRELKEDRHHLREERNELRRRLDEMDDKTRVQSKKIARLGNRLDAMTPFICTLTGCEKRVRNYIGPVSDDSFAVEENKPEGEMEESAAEATGTVTKKKGKKHGTES